MNKYQYLDYIRREISKAQEQIRTGLQTLSSLKDFVEVDIEEMEEEHKNEEDKNWKLKGD